MTLPSGLFTGTPALSGTGFTGTPSISAPFALTVGAAVAAGGVVPNIVITGLSVSPNAYSISKQLKVKTTSDINDVGINITGIPS
jgi:hypothetical protein